MKILLLSAYHAQSHARWCKGLVDSAPHVEWTVLTLPGRRFSWRYPGNAYSWFMTERETLQKDYDLIIATSMVNIATLKGLCPNLANTKTIIYCHENQFAYPLQHDIVQRDWLYFAIQNLYTVLTGDIILFNSQYNKNSLLKGIRTLLKKCQILLLEPALQRSNKRVIFYLFRSRIISFNLEMRIPSA